MGKCGCGRNASPIRETPALGAPRTSAKKSENVINQEQDRLGGETAMRYIQDTRLIVLPQ